VIELLPNQVHKHQTHARMWPDALDRDLVHSFSLIIQSSLKQ